MRGIVSRQKSSVIERQRTISHLDEESPNPALTLPAWEDIAQCDLKASYKSRQRTRLARGRY